MQVPSAVVLEGDALEVMREMEGNSIDALCCDPPAGIAFMSANWDSNRGSRNNWIAWLTEVMAEALRICKPGAHGFVWALPRTSHWTAMALEDAGWEIRDRCTHVFGQGFPKSKSMRDIGRPELGSALKPSTEDWWLIRKPLSEPSIAANVLTHGTGALAIDACRVDGTGNKTFERHAGDRSREQYRTGTTKGAAIPTTQGRFPSQFLLSHIGGPNGCRPTGEMKRVKGARDYESNRIKPKFNGTYNGGKPGVDGNNNKGPNGYANPDGTEEVAEYICHPSCPVALLDLQSGQLKSGGGDKGNKTIGAQGYGSNVNQFSHEYKADSGGASRFFKTFGGEDGHDYEDIPHRVGNSDSEYGTGGGACGPNAVAQQFHPDTHPGEACGGCGGCQECDPWRDDMTEKEKADYYQRHKDDPDLWGEPEYPEADEPKPPQQFHPDTHPGFIYKSKASRRDRSANGTVENKHPTCKNTELMKYLLTLVVPPGGVVLDPFAGSGSTLVAATLLGMDSIGIEKEAEYIPIIEGRLKWATQPEEVRAREKKVVPKGSKPSAYGMPQTRVCNVCGSRTRPHTAGGPWPECGHENWRWVGKDAAPVQSPEDSNRVESDEDYPSALPMCPICKDAPIASGRGVYMCGHNLYYEDEIAALKETLF